MKKKRCQICDGPISNGRCKLCGMPYRNDEILYHLNENRSDHYRHATENARRIMREMEVPLGDKEKQKKAKEARSKIQEQQQKVRQEAVQRINTTKTPNTTETSKKKPAYKNRRISAYGKSEKNAKKTSSWISAIIIIIILLCTLGPSIVEYVQENFGYEIQSFFSQEESADSYETDTLDLENEYRIEDINMEDTQWLEDWLRMQAK